MGVRRAHRLWRKAELQVPKKRRRRVPTRTPRPTPASATNHVWCYGFVHDACTTGQTFKCLTVVDEFARECLAIDVAPSIRSERVIEVLARLITVHGSPASCGATTGPSSSRRQFRIGSRRSPSRPRTLRRASPGRTRLPRCSPHSCTPCMLSLPCCIPQDVALDSGPDRRCRARAANVPLDETVSPKRKVIYARTSPAAPPPTERRCTRAKPRSAARTSRESAQSCKRMRCRDCAALRASATPSSAFMVFRGLVAPV